MKSRRSKNKRRVRLSSNGNERAQGSGKNPLPYSQRTALRSFMVDCKAFFAENVNKMKGVCKGLLAYLPYPRKPKSQTHGFVFQDRENKVFFHDLWILSRRQHKLHKIMFSLWLTQVLQGALFVLLTLRAWGAL